MLLLLLLLLLFRSSTPETRRIERNGTVGYCMCKDMANFSNDQVTFHLESDVVHALCALFEHSLSAAMKFQWILHMYLDQFPGIPKFLCLPKHILRGLDTHFCSDVLSFALLVLLNVHSFSTLNNFEVTFSLKR